jgi:hypothetical protein
MVAWAVAVREALVARFGPSWRAKTTEEIAEDHALAFALGVEDADRLLAFLGEADRAKFAAESGESWVPESYAMGDWESWVATFIAPPAPEAGTSSKRTGK